MASELEMVAAWRQAAVELGIAVVAPFEVGACRFPVLIPEFGRPKGSLIMPIGDTDRLDVAVRAGYFAVQLNLQSYSKFDRKHFEDTLNDLQWFGKGNAPPWYTGKPWTE